MYCKYCGKEIADEAVVCPYCGKQLKDFKEVHYQGGTNTETIDILIKVFLIFGCITFGTFIISLLWVIPLTIIVWKKLNSGEEINVALKVCTLIFVNLVAGILLLCRGD